MRIFAGKAQSRAPPIVIAGGYWHCRDAIDGHAAADLPRRAPRTTYAGRGRRITIERHSARGTTLSAPRCRRTAASDGRSRRGKMRRRYELLAPLPERPATHHTSRRSRIAGTVAAGGEDQHTLAIIGRHFPPSQAEGSSRLMLPRLRERRAVTMMRRRRRFHSQSYHFHFLAAAEGRCSLGRPA